MTFLIGPDSPKAAIAAAFGRELTKAVLTRGVGFKEIERVCGIGQTTLDNYRRGRSLPKTEVGATLADVLEWPKLRALILDARTSTCARAGCGQTFRNEGGSPKKYHSLTCRLIAQNQRLASTRLRQAGRRSGLEGTGIRAIVKVRVVDGEIVEPPRSVMTPDRRKAEAIARLRSGLRIADERNLIMAQAIAAMCADCEPEGICRTPACALRELSPLPLAKHEAVGKLRTSFEVHQASWTPARRAKQAAVTRRSHDDPVLGPKMREARTRGQKKGWKIGLAKAHSRSTAEMKVAATKAWTTRRQRGKTGVSPTAFTSTSARVAAEGRQRDERRRRAEAAAKLGSALFVGRDRRATPAQRREIARLYHVEGKAPSELAIATGLARSTVGRIALAFRAEYPGTT